MIRTYFDRMRLTSVVLVALIALTLAAPLPRVEAADAEFVLSAMRTLQENYVDVLPSFKLLNAALDRLRTQTGAAPFGGPIPATASDTRAAALFVQRFDEILSQVTDRYSVTDLAYAAVAGMLESLHDSHTGFIPPSIYQEEKRRANGQAAFTGIGILLLSRDGQFYVAEIYPDGPAAVAGVHLFDRILAVDGRSTDGLNETEVSSLVRGPAGAPVVLTIARPGAAAPMDLSMVRGPIRVPGVASHMMDGGIGYVKIFEFVPGVGTAFRDAIFGLRRAGMKAMILDLRGNPGGLVDELRDVASAVLPQGTPYLQMRNRGGREVALDTPDPPILPATIPLVALVDADTGSAAELLAAALQEQSRAVLAGTKTAGAVEIGITVDLPEGAGMGITVARVLSGRGTRLEGQGVTPEVAETLTTSAMNLGRDSQLDKALEVLRRTLASGAKSRSSPLRPSRASAA
jgi:carboxyl-terminal processing protease